MFKKILSFTSPAGKALIAAATISFAAGELLWACLIYLAVNALFSIMLGGTVDLGKLITSGVILLAAKTVFSIIADLAKHYAGFNVVENVRVRLIRKLKKLSLGFFTQERLGKLNTVVHKDVENLEGMVGHFLCVMWSDIAVALVMGAWLFGKNWALGLCMISLLPLAVIALLLGLRKSGIAQKRTNDDLADMVSLFVEYAKGIPLMKAFSENSAFTQKLKESIEKFGGSSATQAKVIAGYTGRFSFFLELSAAVMLITGAFLAYKGTVDTDVFLYFVIFSSVFYKPFSKLELYFLEFVKIRDSYRRVAAVLQTPPVPNPKEPRNAKEFDITFENVGFAYKSGERDEFSLRDVNFHVPPGSLTALVGPSGSGKTTVTNLLLRFWDVQTGSVKIGNVDIRDMDYEDLLDRISIVMQNVYLASGSILDNIKIGKSEAIREEVIEAAKRAQIHDFISGLPEGYDTIVGENGVGLSGGQKQRISIARAFIKNAPIVVLDEITSNVDPVNETKIQRAISTLAKDRTVLVIAHHLRTIRGADQIIVFNGGRIEGKGAHEELLKNQGLYHALWTAQEQAKGWKL
ncbi:MAG: ABC transporter ATP-binding protein/permease [Prevotellaceae bacterium]|jgi:ATP-binding cassette subfamily B protein|nr:ABC transporter ATP-binding protein/permease [Prevotellaceae bacterium]